MNLNSQPISYQVHWFLGRWASFAPAWIPLDQTPAKPSTSPSVDPALQICQIHLCQDCFEHQSRGDYLSFLGVIGSVEKFPLVDLQLYFLIYKPEFTWNYDGI